MRAVIRKLKLRYREHGGDNDLTPSQIAAALAVSGAAVLIFANGTNSILQLSTEPSMRGRIMALRVGVGLGGMTIGAPITGWVANHFGPRWSLALGAGAGFAAALVAVYVLARRKNLLYAQ